MWVTFVTGARESWGEKNLLVGTSTKFSSTKFFPFEICPLRKESFLPPVSGQRDLKQGMPENASCVFFAFICVLLKGKFAGFLCLNATSMILNQKFQQNNIFSAILASFQKLKIAYFMQRSRFLRKKKPTYDFLHLFVFFFH